MTESRSPRTRVAAALATGALCLGVPAALAGCGSGGPRTGGGTLSVALRDYRITPQKVRVPAGAVRFEIANDGRLTHSLVVTTVAGTRVAASDPLAPGQAGSLIASLSAGHYLLTSGIQGDKALGLYGTLDVG